MRRMLHAAVLACALALAGCSTLAATGHAVAAISDVATSTAPISAGTLIDDKAFVAAKTAYVAALDASIGAVDVGLVKPKSAVALRIDGLLTQAGRALREAEVFYRALNLAEGRSRAAVAEQLAKRAHALVRGGGL